MLLTVIFLKKRYIKINSLGEMTVGLGYNNINAKTSLVPS